MSLVLAGDLGATNFRCALVDEAGRLTARRRKRLPVRRTREDVITLMVETFHESYRECHRRAASLSLSIKGRVDERRGLSLAMNGTAGWRNVALGRILRSRLGLPVLIENDARCAALGESWKGLGRGEDLVFVIVGTGIGTGIIRDGRIFSGASGHAGEFGHIVIDDSDRSFPCACGERGHWEALAAGPSLGLRARRALARGARDLAAFARKRGGPMDGAFVGAALKAGVNTARQIVEETGRCLGTGLYNVVRAEDPPLVVLGGGASALGKPLLEAARRECARRLAVFGIACPPIALSLLGDDAGLLGAARRAQTRTCRSGR